MRFRGFCSSLLWREWSIPVFFESGKFLLSENDSPFMASDDEVEAGPKDGVRDKAIAVLNKVLITT